MHAIKSLNCLKGPVGRNMSVKDDFEGISARTEEQVIGNWREGDSSRKVEMN